MPELPHGASHRCLQIVQLHRQSGIPEYRTLQSLPRQFQSALLSCSLIRVPLFALFSTSCTGTLGAFGRCRCPLHPQPNLQSWCQSRDQLRHHGNPGIVNVLRQNFFVECPTSGYTPLPTIRTSSLNPAYCVCSHLARLVALQLHRIQKQFRTQASDSTILSLISSISDRWLNSDSHRIRSGFLCASGKALRLQVF